MTTTEQATDEFGAGARSPGVGQGPPASTTASSRRAYERRQRRRQKMSATRLVGPGKPVKSALNRAPFVVVLIALLAGGIAGVLYLNTITDEAGMRASAAKSKAVDLRLTIESLQRDVAMLDATAHIADEAAALGMVPAGDSAMLMVDGSGAGSVVGEPTVVPGPAAPVAPADPAAEALAAQAAAAAAAQAAAAADPAAAAAAQAATDAAAAAAAAAQQQRGHRRLTRQYRRPLTQRPRQQQTRRQSTQQPQQQRGHRRLTRQRRRQPTQRPRKQQTRRQSTQRRRQPQPPSHPRQTPTPRHQELSSDEVGQ